jgi:hypothetical protein
MMMMMLQQRSRFSAQRPLLLIATTTTLRWCSVQCSAAEFAQLWAVSLRYFSVNSQMLLPFFYLHTRLLLLPNV